ncbi:MAG: hypothetical protein LBB75_00110 [Oscillospiraceae bacterium]|jgi:hypothetical protein|nr:hypothetical protein [Oscillospiraceae bacterium]
MKKSVKAALSVLLVAVLTLPCSAAALAAGESMNYVIKNPYARVNFDTWRAYKTQLHVHTNASDGDVPVQKVVEEHYRLGFDILAITDHAAPNRGWNVETPTVPLFRLMKYERTKMAPIIPMPQGRYDEITNGTGADRPGRPMLDVPLGVELNGANFSNTHVNGFFVDYGHGLFGIDKDYETPIKAVHGLGGYSMINHPGDTTGSYANPAVNNDPKTVDKYAGLFLNYYPSCFALDINSISDGTRTDEVLYDNVLEKLIPHGVTPWLVCFSDAHQMGQWHRGFTVHMMNESLESANKDNALEDSTRSMRDGTYFGVYTISPGGVYLPEDAPPYPMVKDVIVAGNTITIVPQDGELVTEVVWVTNGTKEINKGGYTIDVSEFSADIKSFVRAYLRGPGGICYTQPFTVVPEGAALEKKEIRGVFDISSVLRPFVTALDWLLFKWSPLVWVFKRYALGIV